MDANLRNNIDTFCKKFRSDDKKDKKQHPKTFLLQDEKDVCQPPSS